MIVNCDGWITRVPPETEFIEFVSSHERGYAGGFSAFDKDGNRLDAEALGLPDNPAHWTQRIPEVAA